MQDEWLDGGSSESSPYISEESVENKLKGLSLRKATGPNNPNIKVLKMFAKNFAIPLPNIVNESFRSRIFPKIWKRYNVCAILNVTPYSAVEDQTPNFLPASCQRCMQESYAIEWINQDVGANVLLGSSAVLALVKLIHKWYLSMETPAKVYRLYLLILEKLMIWYITISYWKIDKIGLRPALVSWPESYLKYRAQVTKLRNEFLLEF